MLRGHVFKFQTFANEVFAHFINTFLQSNMGVTKGCALTNTNDSVSIGAGYFCIYGRFLEIIGTETISDITNTGYYRLVCEIDLSKVNTTSVLNQAQIKVIRGQNAYPTLTQEDLDDGEDVYQYEFARFKVTENGITDFTDARTFLDFSSIYTQISNNFEALFDAKSDAADALLQDIQDELASIEDRSGLITKNGGVITGDLEVMGMVETDTLKNSNGNKYMNEEKIIILKGDKLLDSNNPSQSEYTQTVWEIDYPTGCNKSNCIILAYEVSIEDSPKIGAFGTTPNSASNLVLGLLPRAVGFLDNKISLQCWNPSSQGKTIHYTLVIMKLPEINITGYELGDINMDHQLNQTDLDLMQEFQRGNIALTDKQFKLADMDEDGKIDSSDTYELIQKINNQS